MLGSYNARYTLTPGEAKIAQLDHNTTCGFKQCAESTKRLAETPYNGSAQNLKMFLKCLTTKVTVSGLKRITDMVRVRAKTS